MCQKLKEFGIPFLQSEVTLPDEYKSQLQAVIEAVQASMKFALPTLMRINNLPFRNVFKPL